MRFFLILIIFCLGLPPLSFSESQSFIGQLYGNYLKGIFYIKEGKYLLGLEELEKAKNKDPQSVYLRLKVAAVLIRLQRFSEAEEVLKEAKAIDPSNLDTFLALIFVYSYTRNDTKLEQEYEAFLKKAHEIKPKDISISKYLAQFYFYKKKPEEAIKVCETVLKTSPDQVEMLFWLGYLYEEVNRRQDAIDTWKKALAIDPSHAPTLNSLGYIYADAGIKLDEAEEMVKRALGQEPENGAYLDSLGWVYFRKKNFEQAQEYLDKAIDQIKDPDIYEHLGDLHVELGDIDKALSFYKKGFLNFPEDEDLKLKTEKYETKSKASKE